MSRVVGPLPPEEQRFPVLVSAYKNELRRSERADRWYDFDLLERMKRHRDLTNSVRHQYASLDDEIVRAVAADFLQYCKGYGLANPESLVGLSRLVSDWDEGRSHVVSAERYDRINNRLTELEEQRARVHLEASERRSSQEKMQQLTERIAGLQRELEASEARVRKKDKKNDELRQRRHEDIERLKNERDQLRTRYEQQYGGSIEYIDLLRTITVLTQSRRAYEEHVLRLSPEQQQVLDEIRLDQNFMIRGSAGTGKSLVLLKAFSRAAAEDSEQLLEEARRRVMYLTFARSLVEYSRYLARVLGLDDWARRIDTVEQLMTRLMNRHVGNYQVQYLSNMNFAERFRTSRLEPQELQRELEDFIWANHYTYDEYVAQSVKRAGLGKPLSTEARREVWSAKKDLEQEMERRGVLSKGYARSRLLTSLSSTSKAVESVADLLFLDEAQDLSATELAILRKVVTGPIVMAGDEQQRIYSAYSPFDRSGVRIVGRTRHLHTNFRNTVQIHEYAQRFIRQVSKGDDMSVAEYADPFRNGPAPEVFQATDRAELRRSLAERLGFFVEELGYQPETIAVAAPTKSDLGDVKAVLHDRGYETDDLKTGGYEREGYVRLTTLHSIKGLSFPVVLLYLPGLPRLFGAHFGDEQRRRIRVSLVYVAVTRAMEHLNVFTNPNADPVLRSLLEAQAGAGAEPQER